MNKWSYANVYFSPLRVEARAAVDLHLEWLIRQRFPKSKVYQASVEDGYWSLIIEPSGRWETFEQLVLDHLGGSGWEAFMIRWDGPNGSRKEVCLKRSM